ncbi:cytochrome P450 [Streptomyces liangshanensis]|uniref:Cytochrome P450 n=1 Tax=Streptomyces liangshanensis TaxID=2717324 RepID=A0A6G9H1E8_9ACTN|nr:cytochrome P450 [Streptomyces liangshanensis]QIQ03957.1 cytochrome P450 [Streptomyces liangshanensis]
MTAPPDACPVRDTSPEPLAYPFWTTGGLGLADDYGQLRDRPPVRVRLPYGDDAWLASSYDDVRAVLSDPRFSLAEAVHRDQPRIGPMPRTGGGLIALDAPRHTRLRALLAKEFTARRVEPLRDRMREVVDGLLDRMVAAGPPADLVEDLAFPLPLTLICELTGVPEEDRPGVRTWADTVCSGSVTPDVVQRHAKDFFARMDEWVEARRRTPADDLITVLVRACDDGVLTAEDLYGLLNELLIGGFVTTTNQIANFFAVLLLPGEAGAGGADVLAAVRDRPGLIPRAVEELLRFVPLLNGLTLPRYASEDVELGGVLVRAGEPVVVSQAAANHDPAAFPSPGRLVLDRPGTPHISFGHGIHYCLGAHLARLELQTTLERVTTRLPGLRLAVPEGELRWRTKEFFSGLRSLPVAW